MKDIVKCPSCAANVEVLDNQKRVFCCHCGSKAFEREEPVDIDALKKQMEDAVNFGNNLASEGMQGSLDMMNEYFAEVDNIVGGSLGLGLFNPFVKKNKRDKAAKT